MKNLILPFFLVISCLFSNSSYAQRFYFRINNGYGTKLGSQYLLFNSIREELRDNIFNTLEYSYSQEIISSTLGQGYYFGGTLGYQIHKNISF